MKQFLRTLFFQVFGHVFWNRPPWIKCLKAKFWCGIVLLLITFGGGYYWYQSQPQPDRIAAELNSPGYGDNEHVTIDFGKKTYYGISPRSVAPLSMVDKSVTQGIDISPPIPGQWRWSGDDRLLFTPDKYWPAGQQYQITFQKGLFAKHIALEMHTHTFTTKPLEICVEDLRLYQDPKDPLTRKIVGILRFNYPVDRISLEQYLHLVQQAQKTDSYPLTLTFDESSDLIAYFESTPISLPHIPTFVNLLIDPGVKAEKGPSKTRAEIKEKLLLPDIDSFLKIRYVDAAIETDVAGDQYQVLSVETSVGVDSSDLQKYLEVYLLPQDYPETEFQQMRKNYSWSQPGEVIKAVLALATPVTLHPLPEEHPHPTRHRLKIEAQTPSHLYIRIKKGMRSFGDFFLSQDYEEVVKTPRHPQEIDFVHTGSLLALSGDKKVNVSVRGIPEVKFSISQLLSNTINHLVAQTHGNFQNPQFDYYSSFDHTAIVESYSEFCPLTMGNPREMQYATLDLGHYLERNPNSLGLFLLKAEGWDPTTNEPLHVEKERLILITDMDLLIKSSANGTHDMFVQSITEGTPVEGAKVSLLGKNGLPIFTATTDTDGHTLVPNVNDFNKERAPTVYLVTHGNDLSFIPFERSDRKLNYSRFDIDGVTSSSKNHLSAFIFSDRGVYRPDETMHIGMIVKNSFSRDANPGLPLEVVITDPRGVTVLNQKMTLPKSNFITLDYHFVQTALTGQYNVKLFIVKDDKKDHLLGYESVHVEEFLPDRLKVEASLVPDEKERYWHPTKGLKAAVKLWNLFGASACNCRVAAKTVLSPLWPKFSKYTDYHILSYKQSNQSKEYTENLTETLSDMNGNVEFDLHLDAIRSKFYTLTFFAEGFEQESGRSVSVKKRVLLSDENFVIGYKAEGNLAYLKQNSEESIHFIAIDPSLEKIAVNNLKAHLSEFKTVSTLVRKRDGTYYYQAIEQENILSEKPLEIGTQGSHFRLPSENLGDFGLKICYPNGEVLATLRFSVVGNSNKPISKNAKLAVKLNKQEYLPGESIEMQITAPYAGAGLITIERDKVYVYKWFKADANSSVQTIALPEDWQGNGYVNVAFVREWNSDEIFMNPLCSDIAPFQINHEKQKLHVQLDAPKRIRAGETLPLQFSTNRPSNIVLFVVDEGILQVADYKTPDPLNHFFRKQALSITTSQIADLILPKHSGLKNVSTAGGDGRLKLITKNFNPFKRRGEKAVAFWSGVVEAGTTPKTIDFQVPDYFNGSLRIMAVAVGSDVVGNARQETQVQSHFVIQPRVPTFVTPGDTVTVTAAITNCLEETNSKEPTRVHLTTTPNLSIIGPMEQQLTLAPGQTISVAFQMKASDNLGEGHVIFTASSEDKESKIASTLSVRPATPYQSHLLSGAENASNKTLSTKRQFYSEYRTQQVSASTNPLILVNGLQDYLVATPCSSYGCTEQLISKAMAQLSMAKCPFFQLDQKKMLRDFNEGLQTLRERKTTNGGFSYWPGAGHNAVDKAVSIYAMDYLTEAKLSGYPVPSDLFNSGLRYLETIVKQDVYSLQEARQHAHAIYLLTLSGMITTNYLTNLQIYLIDEQKKKWQNDITGIYIAATYQMLQNSKEAARLIDNTAFAFPSDLIANSKAMTLLSRHFPDRIKKGSDDPLLTLVQGIKSDPLNTITAAYCIQALSVYAEKYAQNIDASLKICGVLEDKIPLVSTQTSYPQVNFDEQIRQIQIQNPEKKRYFYQVFEARFDKTASKKPVKEGMEIFREYCDSEDKPVEGATLGKKITAHIKARTLNNQSIDHVAIVDLLPAGFEVVPYSIERLGCDYVDVREDRILFFCPLNSKITELSYQLQPVNKGDYAVPPIFAQGIYHKNIQAQGVGGRITVR